MYLLVKTYNSFVSTLCPVIICPYLCTSDQVGGVAEVHSMASMTILISIAIVIVILFIIISIILLMIRLLIIVVIGG